MFQCIADATLNDLGLIFDHEEENDLIMIVRHTLSNDANSSFKSMCEIKYN